MITRQSTVRGGRCLRAALVAVCSTVIATTATAQDTSSPYPRVRSSDQRLNAALRDGVERSPILRRLIQTIDASDGLIYLHEGVCVHGGPACLVMSVRIAGPNRLLHILVDLRKRGGCQIVGSIGHELHHAVEVLSDPSVRSDWGIVSFFYNTGTKRDWGRFETEAAKQVGLDVEREACRRRHLKE